MANDFDILRVKLPSGTMAIVKLPRIFTMQDGVHLMNFLSLYLTDKTGDPLPLPETAEVDAHPSKDSKGGAK